MKAMRTAVDRASALVFLLVLSGYGCARQDGFFAAEKIEPTGSPRLELKESSGPRASFEVAGLGEAELAAIEKLDASQKAALLEIHVATGASDPTAMAGDVSVENGRLRFTPRYPLVAALRYRAVFRRAKLPGADPAAGDIARDFEIPKPPAQPATMVSHIYPSADKLPENQLKFYLHFSAPMSRGEAYRRIRLLDALGKEVADPFLELGEELWDPEMRRFTLLFDPGRIKRGLKPREEVGPVLEEGKSYTLAVDRDWLDAAGQPLAAEARKSFDVLPPDDAPVDTAAWKIDPPQAGTSDALAVRFAEPMDHALVDRMLWITNAAGEKLAGTISIDQRETRWRFTPEKPWPAGEYQLVVDTTLEDLAGNSIGRAFDVDVFEPVQKRIESKTVSLPFKVEP